MAEEQQWEEASSTGHPAPIPGVTLKTLFSHPVAHPIVLDLVTFNKYGIEWLNWELEMVQAKLREDFGNLSMLNFSKLMAMKTLHVSQRFWQSWEVFGWCTMPFTNILPDFEVMQVPTVAQCAISVDIANRTRSDVSWSAEVMGYLSVVHLHEGILVAQPPLEDLVDLHGHAPSGMDVDLIESRWAEVRRTGFAPRGETHDDEQLRRMLDIHEQLEESHIRLRDQLPLVTNA